MLWLALLQSWATNLGRAHVMPYSDASTYHILWSDVVVIESSALNSAEG
jgi:large subunit ribosomal protein L4